MRINYLTLVALNDLGRQLGSTRMKLFALIYLFTAVSVHQINAKRSEVNIEDDAINMISRSGCALDADTFNPCDIDTLSVMFETSVDCDSTISKEEASSKPTVTYLKADEVTLL